MRAMRPERQSQIWRGEAGSRLWLSGLIVAMNRVARPEQRCLPVAPEILAELRAQLELPACCRLSPSSTLLGLIHQQASVLVWPPPQRRAAALLHARCSRE